MMGPKKIAKARNSIQFKKEIIEKFEGGMKIAEIGRLYGKSPSTISCIVAKKEAIKEANVAKGVNLLTKQRSQTVEEVEKLLLIWINQKQVNGDSVSETIIREKAILLFNDLNKPPRTNDDGVSTDFKASRGWFEKFKRRSGIHSVTRHGEGASSDKTAAELFVTYFEEYIEAEGFIPQQVFNCDETGLFWKKMPNRTFITQEEKALPGHKPMKDRLTLLFCGNASGDFKVKPMLVYHSETPRVFSRNKIDKKKLCVMWRANKKAWVTRSIFVEWINEEFGPSVKKYLEANQLPLKCLLLMDNAPSHPPNLEDLILKEFNFITIMFLPPNTTPLIQPMDQQVISNFKKLYTKVMFKRCIDVTTATELTLREYWKNHFNILNCITLIDKAWQEVSLRTMKSAWKKLWPGSDQDKGIELSSDDPTNIVQSIVDLGTSLGLEMNSEDVDELLDDHTQELTTEELQDLQLETQQAVEENHASNEEEDTESKVPSPEIKEFLSMWNKVQGFVEKYFPDKAVGSRVCNLFSDNILPTFNQILKKRQKQTSLDNFFHPKIIDCEAGPSEKRLKTEEIPTRDGPSSNSH